MQPEKEHPKGKDKPETHIGVAVITTSGSYPAEGFEEVPAHQKIKVILEKAVKELKITATDGWVAKVNGKEIGEESTYLDNNLAGQIEIDYGPREGGGGFHE